MSLTEAMYDDVRKEASGVDENVQFFFVDFGASFHFPGFFKRKQKSSDFIRNIGGIIFRIKNHEQVEYVDVFFGLVAHESWNENDLAIRVNIGKTALDFCCDRMEEFLLVWIQRTSLTETPVSFINDFAPINRRIRDDVFCQIWHSVGTFHFAF